MVNLKDDEEELICSASPLPNTTYNYNTVGSAIEACNVFLKQLGVHVRFAPSNHDNSQDGNNKRPVGPSAEILALPSMINLGILKQGSFRCDSIGKEATKNSVVAGNVIALYSINRRRFIRIHNHAVDFGEERSISALPLDQISEQFIVVNRGSGSVAFYSPSHRRFLGATWMNGKDIIVHGYPTMSGDDSPRGEESFYVEEDAGGSISLVSSFRSNWRSETFKIVHILGAD